MLGPYFAQDAYRNQISLRFRVQLAATTGNPDFVVPAGAIADAVAATGGVYTLTMNKPYPVFVGGIGYVMTEAIGSTSDVYRMVNITPDGYNATTGVLTVTLLTDDGDGTDTAENGQDNDWVYFDLCFCDRSTMSPSGAIL